jgi:hypothetical protein
MEASEDEGMADVNTAKRQSVRSRRGTVLEGRNRLPILALVFCGGMATMNILQRSPDTSSLRLAAESHNNFRAIT